jgi:small subunit ribosomal protein S6
VKKYEVMFIVKPAEEEALNNVVTKFENLLQANGATVEKVDRWGKRRLAYEVKEHAEGYYYLMFFSAEPKVIAELDRVMKITDEILKHMIIKEDE